MQNNKIQTNKNNNKLNDYVLYIAVFEKVAGGITCMNKKNRLTN